jgi:hypothetical protein
MLSGRQNVRIGIWGSVEIGRDPLFNTPIVEDAEIKKTWSEMSWRRGRESIAGANQIISTTYAYFKIRMMSAPFINTTHWLIVKGSDGVDQRYDIVDVQPDLQDRDKIVIEAKVRDINAQPAP